MIHFPYVVGHKDCSTVIVPVFNYENPFMLGKGSTPPSDKTAMYAVSSFIESDFG